MNKKKIIFLTGTRADFGKMKPLIDKIEHDENFENYVFVTGMHTLSRYGSTFSEVSKQKYKNMFLYINQSQITDQDTILANTITGFGNFVKEIKPDMVILHGDRIEALAGSIVGAMNHILVSHIEGGEISGHIDESIRHAITKLSHIHFVANTQAKRRLIQMGEIEKSIFIIGSPDIEIMNSKSLPNLQEVKKYYDIPFKKYAIFIFHPVSSELKSLKIQIQEVIIALKESGKQFVIIFPNNDEGTEIILEEYEYLKNNSNFRIFPSIRFFYFLTLLKNCEFIIGNSSVGVREGEVYGIPSINIGSRQNNRNQNKDIINVEPNKTQILNAINMIKNKKIKKSQFFNPVKNSSKKFHKILKSNGVWKVSNQKQFVDLKLSKTKN